MFLYFPVEQLLFSPSLGCYRSFGLAAVLDARRENAALRWCRMFPHRNLLSRGWPGGAQKNSLSRSTSKM